MAILNTYMNFKWKGAYHPLPVPSEFDGLTYPGGQGLNPVFFFQNDHKGCDNDFLDPLTGYFRLTSTTSWIWGGGEVVATSALVRLGLKTCF